MAGKTILILGGGLGGLTVAKQLRNALAAEHRIVVVERQNAFSLSPFNLRFMIGEIKDRREVERPLSKLVSNGIEWVHGEILELDPAARRVRTSSGTLEGDYLVVSLGTEKDGSIVPGFTESAYNLYDADQALQVHKQLQEFGSGRAIVLVCRSPYSCPAAPYEAAFLMDSVFRSRGNRQHVEVAVYTPEVKPMAGAGPAMGDAVIGILKEHDIKYNPQQKVQRIESKDRKIIFENGETSFDLLVGIPPNVAPKVVKAAGMTDESGWIPVEVDTLKTRYPNVFAIGDVTSIKQPNPSGLSLPKAGVFADEHGRVVAANIAAEIEGKDNSRRFDGKGFCYIEVGNGQAAYGSGNFYGYPGPIVYLDPPSQKNHEDRKKLELDQIADLV